MLESLLTEDVSLVRVPEWLSYEEASTLPCAAVTVPPTKTPSNDRHGMLFTHSNRCYQVKLSSFKAQAGSPSLLYKSRTLAAPTSSPHLHPTQNSKLQPP